MGTKNEGSIDIGTDSLLTANKNRHKLSYESSNKISNEDLHNSVSGNVNKFLGNLKNNSNNNNINHDSHKDNENHSI